MNGLLASLRFPFALRGPWAAAAVPATAAPVRAADAALHAPEPFRSPRHPAAAPQGPVRPEAPVLERPAQAVPPVAPVLDLAPEAAAPAPVAPQPIEPSVRVSAAHLVDPVGLRVVPFRPTTRWPLRRAAPRIYDPFRGFPLRSVHLADLMDRRTGPR
jgi:hypothetical protein